MNMRLQYLFLVGIISTFTVLTSCNKDEETPNEPIVGTWVYNSVDLNIMINGQAVVPFLMENLDYTQAEAAASEAFIKATILGEENFQGLSITFNADGTYSIKENGVEEDSGTYQLTNNNTKLLLTSDGDTQEIEVKTLTNNSLSLLLTEEFEEDVTEDGEDETITLAFTLNMTK